MEGGWQRCYLPAHGRALGERKPYLTSGRTPRSPVGLLHHRRSSPAERFGGFPNVPVAFKSFLSDGALARVSPPLSYPEFYPAFLPTDGVLLVRRPIAAGALVNTPTRITPSTGP
jgi:hypothetical protein